MIGAGNDQQFQVLCTKVLEREDLASDSRFLTNSVRVENRAELVSQITSSLENQDRAHWIQRLTGLGYVQTANLISINIKILLGYLSDPSMIYNRLSSIHRFVRGN